MASCPKCGRPKIRKPQGRPRACRRCGTLPNNAGLMRHATSADLIRQASVEDAR